MCRPAMNHRQVQKIAGKNSVTYDFVLMHSVFYKCQRTHMSQLKT
jgi:hypothetical protein